MAEHFNYPGQFNVPASDNPYPSDFINTWESLLKDTPIPNPVSPTEKGNHSSSTETEISNSISASESNPFSVKSESLVSSNILSDAFSVTEAESLCEPSDFSASTVKSKKQKKPKKKTLQESLSETASVNVSKQESPKPVPASNPEIEEKTNSAESSATLDNDEVIDLFGMKSI